MNNFSIEFEGKIFWISRSCAASGFIFILDDGLRVLACKRGIGAPDYQGYWNVPGGYLDYNETLAECCSREIAEETNLVVNPKFLKLYNINDNPIKSNKQNIAFHFWTFSKDLFKGQTVYAKGTELNEVDEVDWIGLDRLDDYEFAFDQKNTIKSIVVNHLSKYIPEELCNKFKRDLYDN